MRQIQRQKDTLTKDIAFGGAIIKVKHYIHINKAKIWMHKIDQIYVLHY